MKNARAVVVTKPGDLSVLDLREIAVAAPGAGQVQVEVIATGVNFIDVYRRQGIYPTPTPFVQGDEGSGRVVALGEKVTGFAVGDLVAWCQIHGSQATLINADARKLVRVPHEIAPVDAAAAMLQGLTAHYLVTSSYPIKPGDVALVHAAAGGVGQLLTQLITHRGGTVVATASSDEKLAIARSRGAAATINYSEVTDLAAAVRQAAGRGVDVVYDGVGKATFDASLASIRPRGMYVLFGGASGQVPPFDLQRLNAAGSLFITRPTLVHHISDRAEFEQRSAELFDWISSGTLQITIGGQFEFADVADAYETLETRRSTGKLVLTP